MGKYGEVQGSMRKSSVSIISFHDHIGTTQYEVCVDNSVAVDVRM